MRLCWLAIGLSVSPALSGLAESAMDGFEDLRFEGVDAEELLIFGERSTPQLVDDSSESRLHRAALIG